MKTPKIEDPASLPVGTEFDIPPQKPQGWWEMFILGEIVRVKGIPFKVKQKYPNGRLYLKLVKQKDPIRVKVVEGPMFELPQMKCELCDPPIDFDNPEDFRKHTEVMHPPPEEVPQKNDPILETENGPKSNGAPSIGGIEAIPQDGVMDSSKPRNPIPPISPEEEVSPDGETAKEKCRADEDYYDALPDVHPEDLPSDDLVAAAQVREEMYDKMKGEGKPLDPVA